MFCRRARGEWSLPVRNTSEHESGRAVKHAVFARRSSTVDGSDSSAGRSADGGCRLTGGGRTNSVGPIRKAASDEATRMIARHPRVGRFRCSDDCRSSCGEVSPEPARRAVPGHSAEPLRAGVFHRLHEIPPPMCRSTCKPDAALRSALVCRRAISCRPSRISVELSPHRPTWCRSRECAARANWSAWPRSPEQPSDCRCSARTSLSAR